MAMTFSSAGCRAAAADLKTASKNLDTILNSELNGEINRVKGVYDSDASKEIYAAYDKMKAKFPDFINAINECATYLEGTVAPAYEQLEKQAASKVQ